MALVQQEETIQLIQETTGLSEAQIQKALEVQKETREPLPQTLVNMGLISDKDKTKILGRQWGIPFIDLSEQTLDAEIVKLLPQHLLQKFKAVPVSTAGNRLTAAMVNPLDVFAIDQMRLVAGMEIDTLIATEEDINSALGHAFSGNDELGATLQEVASEFGADADLTIETSKNTEEEISLDQLKELVDDAPIVRLVNLIIRQALRDKASDIHIQPEYNRVRVRYRIDGILHDSMSVPKQVQAALVSRIKVMAEMDIAEKRKSQDGRISLNVSGKEYDFRVSTYPGVKGEKVVMRVLDKQSVQMNLSRLGISAAMLEDFESLINRSYGIIAVTGPTGSGKSTTLYAALNRLNSPEKNILTIEDPVEYQLGGLTQGQVNLRAGVSFASALRTMLRQDPDIILVGEMRDTETAVIAIEAALTGHLVFSTLHTNDAPGAVARLIEMGVEPFLISSSVIGVVAQRLVRMICPDCKEAYTPPVEAFRRLNLAMDLDSVTFYRGRGCDKCLNTGYRGRGGVFELMVINDHIRELILKRAASHAIRQEALEAGMITLRQDAMQKILEGSTTMEEALRVIYAG
ncbi:MAG: type II secretion system protein GspE [Armatimonadetes bacterium]|nr:type II secretion system protein GspE [Armatimonadota bacterium]NIO74861.1 type II secretion system protein GspE [Armatimonadota bacterium]NIO95623.1 type II secretion system protein GspE [Armatimonadota bacterium]